MKTRLLWGGGLVLFSLVFLTGCQTELPIEPSVEEKIVVWDEDFIIGIIPEQNIFDQKKRYQPICDYLSEKLQRNVKTKLLESYADLYLNMKDEKVDAGFFGSFNYTITHAKLDIIPVARPVWLSNNASTYSGYIFTRRKSGLDQNVEKWRGRKLALVHPQTTAGYFFARWYLFQRGIEDIDAYFEQVMFTGSHDSVVYAVYNQEADLGAAKNHIYNKIITENPKMAKDLVILAESRAVPSNGVAVRKDLPGKLRYDLKKVLLEMDGDPQGQEVLRNFGASKFVETKDIDYQPVREMIAPLGIDLKTYPVGRGRHQYLGEY